MSKYTKGPWSVENETDITMTHAVALATATFAVAVMASELSNNQRRKMVKL